MKYSRMLLLSTFAASLLLSGVFNVCQAKITEAEPSAKTAPHAESAEAFLHRFFYTLANAKSVMEMKKFYVVTKSDDPKADEMLKDPVFAKFALTMMKGEPSKVRVISKVEGPNKVTFQLAPVDIPAQYQAQSKQPGFSMTGEAIVITDNGDWKIYKDYWTVISNESGSKSTFRFGRDPDSKVGGSDGESDAKSPMPEDYESQFRHRIMENWKQSGKGNVYALVHVLPDGKLDEVIIGGETDQKSAFAQAKAMLSDLQPFPALPADKASTPYAWIQLSWSDEGKAISGPYFNDKYATYIVEKLKFKSP